MARIYKRSDRIEVKIDDITVLIAPLTLHQKAEIQQAMLNGLNGDIKENQRGVVLALKYGIKGVKGLLDGDGNAYGLSFEKDELTDECVSDLLNLEMSRKLVLVCASMINGMQKEFKDNNGNPIEGVEIVNPKKDDSEKKS